MPAVIGALPRGGRRAVFSWTHRCRSTSSVRAGGRHAGVAGCGGAAVDLRRADPHRRAWPGRHGAGPRPLPPAGQRSALPGADRRGRWRFRKRGDAHLGW